MLICADCGKTYEDEFADTICEKCGGELADARRCVVCDVNWFIADYDDEICENCRCMMVNRLNNILGKSVTSAGEFFLAREIERWSRNKQTSVWNKTFAERE